MKLLATALLATFSSLVLADRLPDVHGAPSAAYVKESLRPPENHNAYDVLYAKGNRVYQCNPERTGFQHWYNVQTHAFLYPTKERKEPFDLAGLEIGQVAMAPLNGTAYVLFVYLMLLYVMMFVITKNNLFVYN